MNEENTLEQLKKIYSETPHQESMEVFIQENMTEILRLGEGRWDGEKAKLHVESLTEE